MKRKVPHTYVIIAALIVLSAVITWFVPGGQYVQGDDGALVYEQVASVPQTWQVFTALYHGFVKQAGIIVFILVVGGAFWLLNATVADAPSAQPLTPAQRWILGVLGLTVTHSPVESYQRLSAHIQRLFPTATEAQIARLLG